MANTAKTATTFRFLALLAVVLLLVAAALLYFGKSGGQSSAELAVVSQSVPGLARSALRGEPGALDALGEGLGRLTRLRRAGDAPGSAADWQTLSSNASRITDGAQSIEDFSAALTGAAERAESIVQQSDALFDVSGATGVMQEFQQRADRVRQAATYMAGAADATIAAALADDVAYLRSVANALAGEDSALDIRALAAGERDSILLPILDDLSELESHSAVVVANVNAVVDASSGLRDMETSAAALGSAFAGSGVGSSMLPAVLQSPWIPMGLSLIHI